MFGAHSLSSAGSVRLVCRTFGVGVGAAGMRTIAVGSEHRNRGPGILIGQEVAALIYLQEQPQNRQSWCDEVKQ